VPLLISPTFPPVRKRTSAMASRLSDLDTENIITIERACSVFSLLGCVFVLVTFSCSAAFRLRAINRMVFFATFGNMLTNVATLMTRSYTSSVDSFGCQFQAFLIQVYVPLSTLRLQAHLIQCAGSCKVMPTGHSPWPSTSI
jgi:hypothetical protein